MAMNAAFTIAIDHSLAGLGIPKLEEFQLIYLYNLVCIIQSADKFSNLAPFQFSSSASWMAAKHSSRARWHSFGIVNSSITHNEFSR